MAKITIRQWREDWRQYTDEPDDRDHERERSFLEGHANLGARIHAELADVLAAAMANEAAAGKRHRLFLKLFAEFVNALESLGAFGWALHRRREHRLFLDGFLSYPHDAPATFYRSALEDEATLVSVLALPPRETVIQRLRRHIEGGSTAREAGAWLDEGMNVLRQLAEQYFEHNSILLTHYNKAKHGVTMVRLAEHTNDELDFQVLAPQRELEAIEHGYWYDVGLFRASDDMVQRTHNNVSVVTGILQQFSLIAWILYSAELFYIDPAEV
jgi:hypothetical protein